jgi:hypothetical protein
MVPAGAGDRLCYLIGIAMLTFRQGIIQIHGRRLCQIRRRGFG